MTKINRVKYFGAFTPNAVDEVVAARDDVVCMILIQETGLFDVFLTGNKSILVHTNMLFVPSENEMLFKERYEEVENDI